MTHCFAPLVFFYGQKLSMNLICERNVSVLRNFISSSRLEYGRDRTRCPFETLKECSTHPQSHCAFPKES